MPHDLNLIRGYFFTPQLVAYAFPSLWSWGPTRATLSCMARSKVSIDRMAEEVANLAVVPWSAMRWLYVWKETYDRLLAAPAADRPALARSLLEQAQARQSSRASASAALHRSSSSSSR